MRRTLLSLGAIAAVLFILADADAEDWGFVGNTITAVVPTTGTTSYAMHEDGTFEASDGSAGNWTFDGSTLCFKMEGMDDFCGAYDGTKQPGDSWEDTAWDGSGTTQISVAAGIDM